MKNYKTLGASLAIVLAVLLWGMSFVSMKIVITAGLPPFTMITLRYLIVSVILIIGFFLLKKKLKWKTLLKDQALFFWSGAIGITAYFLFEAKGIELTTASSASIIIAMVPIFSLFADWFFFKQRPNWLQLTGIGVSIAGVWLIFQTTLAPLDSASNPMVGNLLMLGACFCWVGYSVLSKNLLKSYNSFHITAIQSFYGTLLFIPFALIESPDWIPVSGNVWLHLLYLALLCSIFAYYLYNAALKVLGITIVSVYVNLIPVVGVIGGVLILNEPLFPIQVLGALMIIVSLFLVNRKPRSSFVESAIKQ